MTEITLTALCGSLRQGSYNRMLTAEAVAMFAPDRYHEGDLRLPLYDGDLEAESGIPEAVATLAKQIDEADAVLCVTPEYNQSLSGVLKNALDWVSRTKGNPWAGKPVAILSAAAGRAGGARAQYALRLCLAAFRPVIVPGPEVLVAGASTEFDENGRLKSDVYRDALQQHMDLMRSMAAAS